EPGHVRVSAEQGEAAGNAERERRIPAEAFGESRLDGRRQGDHSGTVPRGMRGYESTVPLLAYWSVRTEHADVLRAMLKYRRLYGAGRYTNAPPRQAVLPLEQLGEQAGAGRPARRKRSAREGRLGLSACAGDGRRVVLADGGGRSEREAVGHTR